MARWEKINDDERSQVLSVFERQYQMREISTMPVLLPSGITYAPSESGDRDVHQVVLKEMLARLTGDRTFTATSTVDLKNGTKKIFFASEPGEATRVEALIKLSIPELNKTLAHDIPLIR